MFETTKKTIRGGLRTLGYDLVKFAATHNQRAYGSIATSAAYCPWNLDAAFCDTFNTVRHKTLVDVYRSYELWELVEQAAKLPGGAIIEVGVWRGGTGALIAKRAQLCGLDAPVYLCDTFAGVVKAGPNDSDYRGGEHADTTRDIVEALAAWMELPNIHILEGVFPEDTGVAVEDETFRFCHIDVDVYQSAREVVEWIDERMVSGGIYVYDDYGNPGTAGITRWVDEERKRPDRIVIYNLNAHAVVVKTG
jgi:O-methyltransferase